jgi:HK97 family phage major capsid protein
MYALNDISNQMLEDSAYDMEGEIRGEATEQFAVKEGAEIRGTVRAGYASAGLLRAAIARSTVS